jgi:putative heme transporter
VTAGEASASVTGDPPEAAGAPGGRRGSRLGIVLAGAYFVVIFGVLLPQVVDYGEVVAAFLVTPPLPLAIVALLGLACWWLEAIALQVLVPGLRQGRAFLAFLAMAAVGNTVPGPVDLAFGYRMFRTWGVPPPLATMSLTLSSMFEQVGKLLLPALAILLLTLEGVVPAWGYPLALVLVVPVAVGLGVVAQVLRSDAFTQRVGRIMTRGSGTAARRLHRSAPGDLTGRVMDFRARARDLLVRRGAIGIGMQIVLRAAWFVALLAALRATGVGADLVTTGQVLGVYALVMAVTILPIAPGGAGLPELLYITIFTAIAGEAAATPIAAGVMLFRAFQWFLPIPIGYLVLAGHLRNARRSPLAARGAT